MAIGIYEYEENKSVDNKYIYTKKRRKTKY
jgi:hypothetical protein